MNHVSSSTVEGRKVRRPVVLLAVVIVAGLIGVQIIRHLWQKPAVPEATAAELVLRDGRMYRTNHSEPFTGALIERYPNGVLKSRSLLVAGKLEGVSEGWYTNGQMEVREHFKAGVSHGVRTKWYQQGPLLSETTIEEGQHHGTFRRWHENGQLAEEVQMKQGQPDGLSLAYYPSGCLKARTQMQNGKVIEQKFWNDGEVPSAPTAKGTNSP